MLIVLLQQNQQVAAGADLSLALTGQSVSVSAGTLSPSTTVAASGQSAAASAGTLVKSSSLAASGQLVNVSAGTLSIVGDITVSLSGQSASFTAGTLGVTNDGQGFSAGFVHAYRSELERRSRERKRRKELEEETERIEEETAKEIALLLREQEAKDARRSELARLSDLVARSQGTVDEAALSPRALKAIKTAAQKQTAWALFQLEREMQRAQEEEDFVLQALYRALH
jgi:hypothetical protein